MSNPSGSGFFTHNIETVIVTTGISFLQGGVAPAKFWLIAFNPAIEIMNRAGVYGNSFADNGGLVKGGTHITRTLTKLQRIINELTAWGKTCRLIFNPTKTVVVHFTRRRKLPPYKLTVDRPIRGPRPQLMKWAYTSIIRAGFTYACVTWAHELNNAKTKNTVAKAGPAGHASNHKNP